jgi:CsoR family transcriptional regulator, copper-sensing transcriptional repressor
MLFYTYTPGMGIKNKNMKTKKEKTLINFKKAQSLIAKIITMSENNQYCIDIMQQNLAVIGLLRSAHEMLMENHLNTCFRNAMASGNEKKKQEMTNEILKVTNLFNK